MGSLIGQRIDYSGVGVLRVHRERDIARKKWPKQTFPSPLPGTYKQEGQFILCKYMKNLPWSWETTRKPCLAKTLPNSSYLEQCSPTPWLTNINALTNAKKIIATINLVAGLDIFWSYANKELNAIPFNSYPYKNFPAIQLPKAPWCKKKKISMLGLVHGWIDSLYYPIPLQWVYLHWPLKTHPFLLFLGLSKGNLSCKSQSSS